MALVQPCTGCGEIKQIQTAATIINGVKKELNLCPSCLTLLILGNIQQQIAVMGELLSRMAAKILPDKKETIPGKN